MRKNNDSDMMQTSSFNLKKLKYLQFNAITLENLGLVYLLLVDVN